jgi:ATP-binding cassette subfamily F protein 3
MQSQDILQKALIDYPGTLLIVSHNRNFLDPIVQKTMEFRQGFDPRMFAGNLTYYLDKIEAEESGVTTPVVTSFANPSHSTPNQTQLSSKERRKRDASIRERRNKVLKPLQHEFTTVEKAITELESAQATLTTHLESPEVMGDPEKLRETTNAYESISQKLENAYSKWEDLSTQIEKLEAELDSA